jgi:hypothetical protein
MSNKTITVAGNMVSQGERMRTGKGWRLVGPNDRSFKATLIVRKKIGKEDLVIFRLVVPPGSRKRSS